MPEPVAEPITAEGLVALREEIAELEGPARRAMAERIKAARELGDLKENADYHIAKEDQAHLETKIKRLNDRLRRAKVVDVEGSGSGGGDTFAFGRSAEVLDESTGKTRTLSIVGTAEADMAAGKLSVESPVGQGLLNCAVGEQVKVTTPGGQRTYVVKRLVG
ncbi:MAG: transcription elongation factor GreA [Solirubrobacterales bacterium]